MKNIKLLATVLAVYGSIQVAMAQEPKLHVNPKWKECSFQLDQSLTQNAWREFTQEAAYVIYYRPLTDAKPLGTGKFEISLLNWKTRFDDAKPAWNNTFVHPDSTHWLKESPRLSIPGLTFRAGITKKIDLALYWTKSFGANYGFYGGQVQYSLLNNVEKKLSIASRLSFVRMYGPKDVNFSVYGVDGIVSKEFRLKGNWFSVAPYAGVSAILSASHEKSDVVNLKNEQVIGLQGVVGVVAKVSFVRIAVEYDQAPVNTISFKLGATF